MRPLLLIALLAVAGPLLPVQAHAGEAAFPVAVPGFTAPAPGEHPRLLFRKADIPKLKQRAATPEGQAMVARLKRLLGGGEAMPTSFNRAKGAYTSDASSQPIGTYTIGHATGFAYLWILTGDKKYADLAKQCVELGMGGQRDRDDRYSYMEAGGFLRAGPSIVPLAMAYDMAYEGWDAAFRERVRRFLHDYDGGRTGRDGGGQMTLEKLAMSPQMFPGSNHYLCQVGGAGMAVLAVRGDPGSDEAKLTRYWSGIEANSVKGLTEGFGEYGYFHEHLGPSQIASDNGFMIFMQAARVAAGRDFLGPATNGRALATRWIWLLMNLEQRPQYHCRYGSAPGTTGYGSNWYLRGDEGTHQNSHAGAFAQGFGIATPEERAALHWTYRFVVEPFETKIHSRFLNDGERSFDGIMYPHYLVMSLINWPIGEAPRNPGEVMPLAVRDRLMGFYMLRNRWTEAGTTDVVVTALAGARGQDRFGNARAPLVVWGHGEKFQFNATPSTPKGGGAHPKETHWLAHPDGSAAFSIEKTAVAVDFSRASGADAVVVMVNPLPVQTKGQDSSGLGTITEGTKVSAGSTTYHVLVLGGQAVPTAAGADLKVGGQTFSYDGTKLSMAVTAKARPQVAAGGAPAGGARPGPTGKPPAGPTPPKR